MWFCFLLSFETSAWGAIEVMDDDGNRLILDQPVKRIVSLAPHATELLFAAGATGQILATVNFSDYPEAAKKIPRIGGYNKIDIERILSSRPDLVVAWSGGNAQQQIDKIRQLGIKVFISEPKQFIDIANNIRTMGRIMGTEKQARRAADAFIQELNRLKQQYPETAPVKVFYQVWNKPLMTISDRHLVGQIIRFCSGQNIFADVDVISPRVSIEAVIERNPDVIIAGMAEGRESWLGEWDRWTVINAVKNHHVYAIDADQLVRQTPRVLKGARKMCEFFERVRKEHR